jgi:glucose/arabinose dehydrogenase
MAFFAILNKLGIYLSILMCHVSCFTCAYGAVDAPEPPKLNLTVPTQFSVTVFANVADIGMPRMMQFDSHGQLYIAIADANKVVMLKDANKDGYAESKTIVASNLNAPNSVALINDATMLIANQDNVVKIIKLTNGDWSKPSTLIANLPTGGHTLKTVKIGPDGFIYINVGSSCNVCVESDPLRASILRFTSQGQPSGHIVTVGRHAPSPVWATGLRNSQGFAWHPDSQAFYATNEGADNRSESKNGNVNDALPPEHLNIIEQGQFYGWPYCWQNPSKPLQLIQDPNFVGQDNICETGKAPSISFVSHSTPIGITFLNKSQFPKEYKTDAIVALHGSWNRKSPSGYQLVRVKFANNQPVEVIEFATGWLNKREAWGRPVDVVVNPIDGAVYVSDDRTGNIYRISNNNTEK